MNKWMQEYINLKKHFQEKDDANNLLLFFEFMDKLEEEESPDSKKVLVSVYQLLGFNSKAYNLLNTIIDKTDKKALKNLYYLEEIAKSKGDNFAYKRPKTKIEITKIKDDNNIPFFKYHPDPYKTGSFEILKKTIECECCQKSTKVISALGIYAIEDVDYICPHCIADGSAVKKYNGQFIQDAEPISDKEKMKELYERTPGFISWQGEYWLACCDDYCEYLGNVGTKELKEMGISEEVFADYEQRNEFQNVQECLTADGTITGYLFRCLHCKKYHLYVDAD